MPGREGNRSTFPMATGGLARLAAEEACSSGIKLAPLLETAGLTLDQIRDSDERLRVNAQIAFLEGVARAMGRDRLGFELAQHFDLRRIGLLYYVAASSATLLEALQRAERFSAVSNEAVAIACIDAPAFEIRLNYAGVARHSDRHQIEFFLVALVRICRFLTGRAIAPISVRIAHARSGDLSAYHSFFGCRAEFQADCDSVIFGDECKLLPVVSADPYLNSILVRHCDETLASRRKAGSLLRVKVENVLATLLPHGRPTIKAVARQLNLSSRTLSRRLATEDLRFGLILEEMRRDLAIRYLEDATLSISQIAWLLGFQEVGAFTHAFRRWTGSAPSEMWGMRRDAGATPS
jgi:AraC-like DNA-binding protein